MKVVGFVRNFGAGIRVPAGDFHPKQEGQSMMISLDPSPTVSGPGCISSW